MDLKEIMQFKNFCVVGDTLNEEKYAYRIKQELIKNGYDVSCVGKELATLNEVDYLEVIDLCIHPAKGIKLLTECSKDYKVVLIQPGAESPEIIDFLKANKKDYLEGCALVGLNLYKRE